LNRRQSPACITVPFSQQKRTAMNKQTEQLKRRLYNKIESIEDAEYLASLDAVITWETICEKPVKRNNWFSIKFYKEALTRIFWNTAY
jgi:hypothetical protein